MPKLRVHNFTLTLDGYGAGTNQRPDAPFGDGVDGLHDWMFATRTMREDGATGIDDDAVTRYGENVGATIMGRNMFGPVRGPWPDHTWTGWWGDDPPFHQDVFVLTHHERPSVEMAGGTTFHFVDGTLETVLHKAFEAANGQDVRIAGGAATIRQYLRAGLVDELDVVIAPLLAGAGERLFDDLGGALAGYQVVGMVSSTAVTHVNIRRTTRTGS